MLLDSMACNFSTRWSKSMPLFKRNFQKKQRNLLPSKMQQKDWEFWRLWWFKQEDPLEVCHLCSIVWVLPYRQACVSHKSRWPSCPNELQLKVVCHTRRSLFFFFQHANSHTYHAPRDSTQGLRALPLSLFGPPTMLGNSCLALQSYISKLNFL